jgi:hypothetical protein
MSGSVMENHNELETNVVCAGFEVLVDVVMKSFIVWDIRSRSLKVNLYINSILEYAAALYPGRYPLKMSCIWPKYEHGISCISATPGHHEVNTMACVYFYTIL